MTGIAGVQGLMMTDAAGIRISFVGLVIEWNEIYVDLRLNSIFGNFHQDGIRLLALHARDIGQFFDFLPAVWDHDTPRR